MWGKRIKDYAIYERPAAQLVYTKRSSRSYLGGHANLPVGMPWPEYKGKPLRFLARISLLDVHRCVRMDWLPKDGALLFFYDINQETWGFDPNDRGSWRVIYVRDSGKPVAMSEEDKCQPVACKSILTLIDSSLTSLTDDEADEYCDEAESRYGDLEMHQVGGYPLPIQQAEMDLECQLVTNGVYTGNAKGWEDPRIKELEPGAKDWRLLFQLDSDEDLDFCWGDCGILYFWIREQDARAGNFDNVWMILQCT